jgi:hypothetical protein
MIFFSNNNYSFRRTKHFYSYNQNLRHIHITLQEELTPEFVVNITHSVAYSISQRFKVLQLQDFGIHMD